MVETKGRVAAPIGQQQVLSLITSINTPLKPALMWVSSAIMNIFNKWVLHAFYRTSASSLLETLVHLAHTATSRPRHLYTTASPPLLPLSATTVESLERSSSSLVASLVFGQDWLSSEGSEPLVCYKGMYAANVTKTNFTEHSSSS